MKRTHLVLAGAVACVSSAPIFASAASSVASAAGSATARSSRVAKVDLERTSLGKVLVDTSGFTLYRFTKDGRDSDTCVKVSHCLGAWPALASTGRPVAGPGVKASLLSTIKLSDGQRQVTYAGHPLYLYAEASERAETAYVGAEQFGGRWDAVNAAGNTVK
jgi:predicted lipoprotein with Yx(FWY)xxD motif